MESYIEFNNSTQILRIGKCNQGIPIFPSPSTSRRWHESWILWKILTYEMDSDSRAFPHESSLHMARTPSQVSTRRFHSYTKAGIKPAKIICASLHSASLHEECLLAFKRKIKK